MNKRDYSEDLEDLENWGAGNLARGRWLRDAETPRKPRGRKHEKYDGEDKRQRQR